MDKQMYWLPILVDALQHNDTARTLVDAFVLIRQIGRSPEYLEGFRQFLAFMYEAGSARGAGITVIRDGVAVGRIMVGGRRRSASLPGVTPGHYSIELWTGQVLWDGMLSRADLLWDVARPGKNLRLAADTGGGGPEPTREEQLIGNRAVLRIFPGVETGQMRIELR
ncbi:MAG: hypothetical protein HOJ57_28680 [Lentisphaerae bacterium]|nr:hypothetical protein [Lentisphaerota bacterium]MBT5609949.1 hypothetical protein [Lentisphaerota bacterium]